MLTTLLEILQWLCAVDDITIHEEMRCAADTGFSTGFEIGFAVMGGGTSFAAVTHIGNSSSKESNAFFIFISIKVVQFLNSKLTQNQYIKGSLKVNLKSQSQTYKQILYVSSRFHKIY